MKNSGFLRAALLAVAVSVPATAFTQTPEQSIQDVQDDDKKLDNNIDVKSIKDFPRVKARLGKGPILVVAHASWCPPCQAFKPELEKYAAKNPDATVVRIEVKSNENAKPGEPKLIAVIPELDSLIRDIYIDSIPTTALYDKSLKNKVHVFTNSMNAERVEQLVDQKIEEYRAQKTPAPSLNQN